MSEQSKYSVKFTPRDPRTDPPPCDGTQAMWGYKDGEILSGESHYMFTATSETGPLAVIDPDIVWWFGGEDLAVALEDFLHPKPEEET